MLNRIKALFGDLDGSAGGTAGAHGADELQLAAAALLVEAAQMDDRFEERERAKILQLVRDRFALSEDEAASLVETASRRVEDSSQLFGFTRVVNDRFSFEERIELMEMLWQVVYADGVLHDYEANLMRRIAGLLHVTDRDNGEARKRALSRLDPET